MEFQEVLRKRRMIRAYTAEDVTDQQVWRLLRNAARAPSAGHTQPQEFIVIRDPQVKRRLAEAALDQSFVAEAPVVIAVCADTSRSVWRYGERGVRFYSIIDGAFASLLILLTCVDLGLAACFVGAFNDEAVARVLGLPKHVRPIGLIPVGHAAERPGGLGRIPLMRLVHHERW